MRRGSTKHQQFWRSYNINWECGCEYARCSVSVCEFVSLFITNTHVHSNTYPTKNILSWAGVHCVELKRRQYFNEKLLSIKLALKIDESESKTMNTNFCWFPHWVTIKHLRKTENFVMDNKHRVVTYCNEQYHVFTSGRILFFIDLYRLLSL